MLGDRPDAREWQLPPEPLMSYSLVGTAQAAEPGWMVKPVVPSSQQLFPQGSVRLLEGPFKTMQDVDHAYFMRLELNRLLAPFRVEAGLEPKAKPYGGWEGVQCLIQYFLRRPPPILT